MTALPRATCTECGNEVAVRRGGELREHRGSGREGGALTCPGSGRPSGTSPAVERLRAAGHTVSLGGPAYQLERSLVRTHQVDCMPADVQARPRCPGSGRPLGSCDCGECIPRPKGAVEVAAHMAAKVDGRRVHPAAAAFPMLDDEGLRALAADIEAHGLIEPIVVHDGVILDGRNRLAACELIDVEPDYRDWEGDDADITSWIISKNIHRRHLDTSQRAMVAAKLATLERGTNQHASIEAPSQAAAAEMLNVGRASVQRAREVLASGDAELVRRVEQGEVTVSKAAEQVRPALHAELRAEPDGPRCGALHPETGLPCGEKPGHVWTHGYIEAGVRIWWAREVDGSSTTVKDPVRPQVPPALDDEDAVDDPFGELADTDTDTDTPVTGPEAEALLEVEVDEDEAPPADPTPISESATYDSDSWSTPDDLIAAAREVFGGEIDLDPATNPKAQARIGAVVHYTKDDNGLDPARPWKGRTWLNPPYRRGLVGAFIDRLLLEHEAGNVDAAILLVNNCTDTKWCQNLLQQFPACFIAGRVGFLYDGVENDSGARQGQVAFYLGPLVHKFTLVFKAFGVVVDSRG